jgi:hypothetical protein
MAGEAGLFRLYRYYFKHGLIKPENSKCFLAILLGKGILDCPHSLILSALCFLRKCNFA